METKDVTARSPIKPCEKCGATNRGKPNPERGNPHGDCLECKRVREAKRERSTASWREDMRLEIIARGMAANSQPGDFAYSGIMTEIYAAASALSLANSRGSLAYEDGLFELAARRFRTAAEGAYMVADLHAKLASELEKMTPLCKDGDGGVYAFDRHASSPRQGYAGVEDRFRDCCLDATDEEIAGGIHAREHVAAAVA